MAQQSKKVVQIVTRTILKKLNYQLEGPSSKATLATIRKTIGKPLSDASEIWPILYENLPAEFINTSEEPSKEELAIYTAVQLYALHQQGKSTSVHLEMDDKYKNIGNSLRYLRIGEDTTAIDRRFNVLMTSSTFEEVTYHLRHLVQLLKSKAPDTKVDYGLLAGDLYTFLKQRKETVRLNWAKCYYQQSIKGEVNHENE